MLNDFFKFKMHLKLNEHIQNCEQHKGFLTGQLVLQVLQISNRVCMSVKCFLQVI